MGNIPPPSLPHLNILATVQVNLTTRGRHVPREICTVCRSNTSRPGYQLIRIMAVDVRPITLVLQSRRMIFACFPFEIFLHLRFLFSSSQKLKSINLQLLPGVFLITPFQLLRHHGFFSSGASFYGGENRDAPSRGGV